jgi:hypothetical protein
MEDDPSLWMWLGLVSALDRFEQLLEAQATGDPEHDGALSGDDALNAVLGLVALQRRVRGALARVAEAPEPDPAALPEALHDLLR